MRRSAQSGASALCCNFHGARSWPPLEAPATSLTKWASLCGSAHIRSKGNSVRHSPDCIYDVDAH